MASLQTEDALPGGLRFLTLQHAHEVANSRAQNTVAKVFTASTEVKTEAQAL
ncbi:hypothetical protein CDV36_015350 [Fusarium kuroshium]|uniref:Uncharacterized protein n=1 Tax=Fusarium kuroshium TaxID=2010991 RepID=A0A3M2RAP6_9HYPO|nr:hypothetical protein CDV36_015350 [Fusarium kuroshium]